MSAICKKILFFLHIKLNVFFTHVIEYFVVKYFFDIALEMCLCSIGIMFVRLQRWL